MAWDFEEVVSKFWHKTTQNIVALVRTGSRDTADKLSMADKIPLAHIWGLGASYAVDAYINYRDFKFEEDRLRHFFESEIAAQQGKNPEVLTNQDMYAVAEHNPTIAEALHRNKKNSWVNFAVSALAITAAVVATTIVLTAFFPAAPLITTFLVGMASGLPVFLGAEYLLEQAGKKIFHLDEPSINEVSRQPNLQHELSLPGQIRYLERLQSRRMLISQEQVFSTFLAARSDLAAAITSRYGAPFETLSDPIKEKALLDVGPQHNLEQITEDLNNRLVRAQELAFLVQGQKSGVAKLDVPHQTALERTNVELQQKLLTAQQKIGSLSEQVKTRASSISEKIKERSPFRKSDVRAAVPENQEQAEFSEPKIIGPQTAQVIGRRQSQLGTAIGQ